MSNSLDCEKQFLRNDYINSIYSNLTDVINGIDFLECQYEAENKEIHFNIKFDNEILNYDNKAKKRIYYKNRLLRKNNEESGTVILHKNFFLKEKFRKRGIAKAIHKNEIIEYKKYNNSCNDDKDKIKEIHLNALFDGVIVWQLLGFKVCHMVSLELLFIEFIEYLDEKGVDNKIINELEDLYNLDGGINENVFMDINKKDKSLFDKNGETFTHWFLKKVSQKKMTLPDIEDKTPNIKMYKEVV